MIDLQDLEDRIASLERATRGLGVGQQLTVGDLFVLGATEITASDIDHGSVAGLTDDDHAQYIKDAEFAAKGQVLMGTGSGTFSPYKQLYNVKAFGAVGDGSTRDDLKIQDAIDAANAADGGIVFIPPGYYKIDAPMKLKEYVSILGCGYRSALKGADMSYPILETRGIDGVWQSCWLKDFRIYYDKPGDTSTWVSKPPAGDAPGAKAIYFPTSARQYLIENIVIQNAYAGIWDDISFGGEIRHVRTTRCQHGIYRYHPSNAITTMRLIDIFASGTADDENLGAAWDIRAFHVRAGFDVAVLGCAVNEYAINTNIVHLNFNSGSEEFTRGELITGAISGDTGVASTWAVTSGTWGGNDAAGELSLENISGMFQAEDLNGSVGGNNMASSTGAAVGYKAALAFEDLEDFQLAQLNLEANEMYENAAVIRIDSVRGFTINGIWEWNDILGTGDGVSEALVVRGGSVGVINGAKLGGSLVTATGTGTAYILRIMDDCFVTVNSGSLKDPAGSGMTKWGIVKEGTGGSLTVNACDYDSDTGIFGLPFTRADKDSDGDFDSLTSTSWDGDAKAAGNGTINWNTVFGVPTAAKAVVLRLQAEDETVGVVFELKAKSTTVNSDIVLRTQVSNLYVSRLGVVAIAADGTSYYNLSGEMDATYIQVVGWYI